MTTKSVKEFTRHFSKEHKAASEYVKRCSILKVITGVEIKGTVSLPHNY